MSEIELRVSELERRIEEMVVRGVIKESNPKEQWVTVSYGTEDHPMTTAKLPVKPLRAGKAIVWWWPEQGEAVTVISPGDLRFGEVYPGSYYSERPAPSDDPDLFLIEFGDGSRVSQHRKSHLLEVVNVGDVVVSTKQNLTVNTQGNANINADGNVTCNGKKITLSGGAGVITAESICPFTKAPHSDASTVVFAKK